LETKNLKSHFHPMKVFITTLCKKKLKEKVRVESQALRLNEIIDSMFVYKYLTMFSFILFSENNFYLLNNFIFYSFLFF
jgi:hypothetical protein